jgi:predicted negative regulator of RcsB-dependent stress response
LRGDIYLALGRVVDARDAYTAAQQAGSSSDGLRMKLDNLPDEG